MAIGEVFAGPLRLAAIAVICCGCLLCFGCGADSSAAGRVLTTHQVLRLFEELPYEFTYKEVPKPKGVTGVVAGQVAGPHRVKFDFAVALGHSGVAVPVPRAGTRHPYGGPGFVFTDNGAVPGAFRTREKFYTAGHMVVEMEEKLCKASTGSPCEA